MSKAIDVRITFNVEDGGFDRYDASALHEAICRAHPYLRYSEVTVAEIPNPATARRGFCADPACAWISVKHIHCGGGGVLWIDAKSMWQAGGEKP